MYENDLSIIVSTKNRSSYLFRLLNSMCEMDFDNIIKFEVIVVDNGSNDNTQSVIESFYGKLPIVNIIEKTPGKSRAINYGIIRSSGRIIMLTDDDCVVSKNWISESIKIFDKNDMILAGGRIELYDEKDLPITILTSKTKRVLENPDDVFSFIFGANMSFSHAVFKKIGGFDHRLGPGLPTKSAEDVDFVYRAFKSGIPVIYEPDMLVSHGHGRRTENDRFKQISNYSVGDGAISTKYIMEGDFFIFKNRLLDYKNIIKNIRYGKIYRVLALLRLRFVFGVLEFFKIRKNIN